MSILYISANKSSYVLLHDSPGQWQQKPHYLLNQLNNTITQLLRMHPVQKMSLPVSLCPFKPPQPLTPPSIYSPHHNLQIPNHGASSLRILLLETPSPSSAARSIAPGRSVRRRRSTPRHGIHENPLRRPRLAPQDPSAKRDRHGASRL